MLAPPDDKPDTPPERRKPLHVIEEQLVEKLLAVGITKRVDEMTHREAEDAQDLLLAKWLSVPREVVLTAGKRPSTVRWSAPPGTRRPWRKWPA